MSSRNITPAHVTPASNNPVAIQDAARRYLDTGNYVRVTLFPEATAAPKK